jgi:hypothetical protein
VGILPTGGYTTKGVAEKGAMKDWPRLSPDAIARIERVEFEADRRIGDRLRPYTPGNRAFSKTLQNMTEGGYRAIDHVCSYAEELFNGHAEEYVRASPLESLDSNVLTDRIAIHVEQRATFQWTTWLFVNLIGNPSRGKGRVLKSSRTKILLRPPDELKAMGIEQLVIKLPTKEPDPKWVALIAQLGARHEAQLKKVLVEAVFTWATEAENATKGHAAKKRDSGSKPADPDRRAIVDAFLDRVLTESGRGITRTDLWKVAGYKDATQFERFQRNHNASYGSLQKFNRLMKESTKEFLIKLDRLRPPE